jgi:hypothetical protein
MKITIDLDLIAGHLKEFDPDKIDGGNVDGWSDALLDALEHEYDLETKVMGILRENTLTDDDYIKIAYDHLGSAIRDNSREEKIEMGKKIENGTWEGGE